MKPRPPTLRDRRRYVLAACAPEYREPDPKTLYYTVLDAATALYGDAATAAMQISVMAGVRGYAILRCRRGEEWRMITACATVTSLNGSRIALHPVAVSGTMHALRRRIRSIPEPSDGEEVMLEGEPYCVRQCSGQNIDLIKKSIKNQKTLYFTQKDREEF
ncbi:MAG: ribonuclease P [Methanomicrobiales archaeon]|nr:ribonuclease P [Methanomicrobiales archaeon]